MITRRRALVLTSEAARHPFRASLPSHVTSLTLPPEISARPRFDLRDWRGFATAYCSTFLAVSLFIA